MRLGTEDQTVPASSMSKHPAWFGAVLGTGAMTTAIGTQVDIWHWTWLNPVVDVLIVLTSLLALLLLPRYMTRLRDRKTLWDELGDPARGPMLATLPAGIMVLALIWGRFGSSLLPHTAALWVSAVLLTVGATLSLAVGLAWASSLARTGPGLEGVTGGWLIPPVSNLLIPLTLPPLIVANHRLAPALTLLGFAFLGVGVVLFLGIFGLLLARLTVGAPITAMLAPTLWIPLAPAGVIGLATLRLEQAAVTAHVPGFTGIASGLTVCAMGLGFGLWWAGYAAIDLRRIHRAGPAPAHPGWWGFVFPAAAMTLSLSALGAASGVGVIKVAGLIATVALVGLWTLVAARTIRLAR